MLGPRSALGASPSLRLSQLPDRKCPDSWNAVCPKACDRERLALRAPLAGSLAVPLASRKCHAFDRKCLRHRYRVAFPIGGFVFYARRCAPRLAPPSCRALRAARCVPACDARARALAAKLRPHRKSPPVAALGLFRWGLAFPFFAGFLGRFIGISLYRCPFCSKLMFFLKIVVFCSFFNTFFSPFLVYFC